MSASPKEVCVPSRLFLGQVLPRNPCSKTAWKEHLKRQNLRADDRSRGSSSTRFYKKRLQKNFPTKHCVLHSAHSTVNLLR